MRLLATDHFVSGEIYAVTSDPMRGEENHATLPHDQDFGTSILIESFVKRTVFSAISPDSLCVPGRLQLPSSIHDTRKIIILYIKQ
jgi:hypothetical protein